MMDTFYFSVQNFWSISINFLIYFFEKYLIKNQNKYINLYIYHREINTVIINKIFRRESKNNFVEFYD